MLKYQENPLAFWEDHLTGTKFRLRPIQEVREVETGSTGLLGNMGNDPFFKGSEGASRYLRPLFTPHDVSRDFVGSGSDAISGLSAPAC